MVTINDKVWFSLHGKRHDHDIKQSNSKVEQSSFTLIALFLLKIGRCSASNLLNPTGHGGHDASPPFPKNIFDHCAQTLRRGKLKLCDI